ncbi:MAG: hypothetical protein WC945_04390 [Bacteroidales bacterium]
MQLQTNINLINQRANSLVNSCYYSCSCSTSTATAISMATASMMMMMRMHRKMHR